MRITDEQKSTIRRLVQSAFGDTARVLVFGSRVDDDITGGDVDLLVQTAERVSLAAELSLIAKLEQQLGLPVDVITTSPDQKKSPIAAIAQHTGVELWQRFLGQQQALLEHKFHVLGRLQTGLEWSFERLPPLTPEAIEDPAVSERISAIVDRFAKLQDQLAGALRQAHNMLGEKNRSFTDVIVWAVDQKILPDTATWLELRTLRNRVTHEYDLESDQLPELITLVRNALTTLAACIKRSKKTCRSLGLLA